MHRFIKYIIFFSLVQQSADAQLESDTSDYLYGYKTLFLSIGATSQGRFLTLGYMLNRYVFELEAAAEPRKVRLRIDSLTLNRNRGLGDLLNTGGSHSNIAQYIGTLRGFYREKFKFLGALFELDAGMNVKAGMSKGDNVANDTMFIPRPVDGRIGTMTQFDTSNDDIAYSAGPSLRMKVSSGRERGEAVLSLICNIDLNYYFSNKNPSVTINVGLMLAPFSYH